MYVNNTAGESGGAIELSRRAINKKNVNLALKINGIFIGNQAGIKGGAINI